MRAGAGLLVSTPAGACGTWIMAPPARLAAPPIRSGQTAASSVAHDSQIMNVKTVLRLIFRLAGYQPLSVTYPAGSPRSRVLASGVSAPKTQEAASRNQEDREHS